MNILIPFVLLVIFIVLIVLKIISFSMGRKIISSLKNNPQWSQRLSIGFNLKTISLSDEQISGMPMEIQKDLRKKRKFDIYFFVVFAFMFILLALKVFTNN